MNHSAFSFFQVRSTTSTRGGYFLSDTEEDYPLSEGEEDSYFGEGRRSSQLVYVGGSTPTTVGLSIQKSSRVVEGDFQTHR